MRLVLNEDGSIWPFDADAKDMVAQLGGEPFTACVIEVEVLHERDMVEHRRIMATINDLAKALHTTPERLRAELLVATGNFQLLGDLLGTPMVAVNSMSRRNMKDHELHEFWSEAREVIRNKLLAQIPDTAERERLTEQLSLQPV
jgi:hypothetical protein